MEINEQYLLRAKKGLDGKYGKVVNQETLPFASPAEACSMIPIDYRHRGLVVIIEGGGGKILDYWWEINTTDAGLVGKSANASALQVVVITQDTGLNFLAGDVLEYLIVQPATIPQEVNLAINYSPSGAEDMGGCSATVEEPALVTLFKYMKSDAILNITNVTDTITIKYLKRR